MSILSPPPASSNGHERKPEGVRTYRGRRLEDIIPQIREELGPDAVILRQREGLMGGVSGFFAQRCVEIDARRGTPPVDLYDDDDGYDDQPEAMVGGASTQPPVPASPPPVADSSFANQLDWAREEADEEPRVEHETEPPATPDPVIESAATPDPATEPPATPDPVTEPAAASEPVPATRPKITGLRGKRRARRPPVAKPRPETPQRRLDELLVATATRELVERGLSDSWAHELISLGGAHGTPFAGGDLRAAARASLAAALPAARPLPASGAAVAIVGAGGAGKTRAAAALACAYGRHSTLPVTVVALGSADHGAELAELLCEEDDVHVTAGADARRAVNAVTKGRANGFVVIDTMAAPPRDAVGVAALALELDALAPDAVYIAVPATLSPRAGANLIDRLAQLGPTGIVITHADETDGFGVAVELSRNSRIPVAYVHDGLELDRALSAADPSRLAEWLLP